MIYKQDFTASVANILPEEAENAMDVESEREDRRRELV